MAHDFESLFQPLDIGPVRVKNRIAMAPMGTGFASDSGAAYCRLPSSVHAHYYADRARGGAGLIIMEATLVHPTSSSNLALIYNFDDRVIPGFQKITEMVHGYDAKIFVQLACFGRQNTGVISRLPLWAPSPIPCPVLREVPKEMEKDDIEEAVRAWGLAAARAKKGGFDGVELHSSHTGYLICQFLSPLTNKRTDEYGGSLENRMRFLHEVIDSMRANIGPEMALGVRLSPELIPGGLTLEDIKEIAGRVESTGKVDYIHVDAGCYSVIWKMFPRATDRDNTFVDMAAGVKEAVNRLPVFTVGKIREPENAATIISEGKADMVVLGRALIADPEWPAKVKDGRLKDIRPCISCNEQCIGRVFRLTPLGCIHNPAVGKEKEWGIGTIRKGERRKRVLVIGGGPGGLESARVASLRGHEVTLCEKQSELGGLTLLSGRMPGSEIRKVTEWLERQVRDQGVEVILDVEAGAEFVMQEKFDTVVVATGSRAGKPAVPGSDQGNVFNERQVMAGNAGLGDHIVIVDGGWGFWQCCGVTEYLAEKGKQVEVITPLLFAGQEVSALEIPPLYQRLLSRKVDFRPLTAVKEISGRHVVTHNVYSLKETLIEDVDSVVFSWFAEAEDGLYKELKGKVSGLYRIGDCVAPRHMAQAIYEGHRIGRVI